MVDGVADQVRQRVAHLLHHAFVEFGVFAGHFQPDVLRKLNGKIAHQPRETPKDVANGKHAHAHHTLLQLADVPLHLGHGFLQLPQAISREIVDNLVRHGLCNHQFAHQVHQLVHLRGRDAYGSIAGWGRGHRGRRRRRCYRCCRNARLRFVHFHTNLGAVFHKREDVPNLLHALGGHKPQLPSQVAALGIQIGERRQLSQIQIHLRGFADFGEIAQNQ